MLEVESTGQRVRTPPLGVAETYEAYRFATIGAIRCWC